MATSAMAGLSGNNHPSHVSIVRRLDAVSVCAMVDSPRKKSTADGIKSSFFVSRRLPAAGRLSCPSAPLVPVKDRQDCFTIKMEQEGSDVFERILVALDGSAHAQHALDERSCWPKVRARALWASSTSARRCTRWPMPTGTRRPPVRRAGRWPNSWPIACARPRSDPASCWMRPKRTCAPGTDGHRRREARRGRPGGGRHHRDGTARRLRFAGPGQPRHGAGGRSAAGQRQPVGDGQPALLGAHRRHGRERGGNGAVGSKGG